ncbi:MAG: DUF697 domain-containing protein [Bacteroidales bacterium]|nr:DUF697 domain-containing protein [Bacteroidales bacterium]
MEEKQIKSKKEVTSESIIKRHMYWSVSAGLIPFPLLDIAAVTAVQTDMLKSLCNFYKVDYSQEKGKAWITALTAATLSSIIARTSASVVKVIPAIGTVVGMASMAIISGASTYAVGNVFVNHFEAGGTLQNFNTDNFKKFYIEKLEEGKDLAKKMKDKYKAYTKKKKGKDKEKTVISKLKELNKLKDQKLINEKEYTSMRNDILKQF